MEKESQNNNNNKEKRRGRREWRGHVVWWMWDRERGTQLKGVALYVPSSSWKRLFLRSMPSGPLLFLSFLFLNLNLNLTLFASLHTHTHLSSPLSHALLSFLLSSYDYWINNIPSSLIFHTLIKLLNKWKTNLDFILLFNSF